MRDARARKGRPGWAAVAAALAALAAGAPPARADGVELAVTPSLVSQYMFRGVRLGGLSFEPSVEVDMGNGALGIWCNFPVAGRVDGLSSTEIDPYGSYTIAIGGGLSVEPGFTFYTYPEADAGAGDFRSTFEPYLAVNYTFAGVTLTPKICYDFTLDGPTLEFTAAYSVPVRAARTSLEFAATAGTYSLDNVSDGASPRLRNWGDYWLLGVTLPFSLSRQSTLTLGFAYTDGADNYFRQGGGPRERNDGAVGRGVASVAYALAF